MDENEIKDIALAKFAVNQLYGSIASTMHNEEEKKEIADKKVVENCKKKMDLLSKYRAQISQREIQQKIINSCNNSGKI